MRAVPVATLLFALLLAAARAGDAPNPAGCISYGDNKTGSDADCDKAIASETDAKAKSTLLFRRAYMEDAAGDFATYPKALADLDAAIRLWPQNAAALEERGYLYNEYGRWKDALADLDAHVALQPGDARGYRERSLARFRLGDLQGSFDDDNTAVTLAPDEAGTYLSRANSDRWLGRFDAARNDLDKAEALAAQSQTTIPPGRIAEVRALLAKWMKTSAAADPVAACSDADKKGDFARDGLIGDCTRAFLDARTPKGKADALTTRAMAWLIGAQDEEDSTGDYEIAAALSPDAGTLSNVGFAYMRSHHSTAAIPLFDASIAAKPDFFNYAGRAAAKSNTRDYQGAIDDAKRSLAVKTNDLALTVEGDAVYAQTKSYDEAKAYWVAAYKLGHPDAELVARLKAAGVPIPPP